MTESRLKSTPFLKKKMLPNLLTIKGLRPCGRRFSLTPCAPKSYAALSPPQRKAPAFPKGGGYEQHYDFT